MVIVITSDTLDSPPNISSAFTWIVSFDPIHMCKNSHTYQHRNVRTDKIHSPSHNWLAQQGPAFLTRMFSVNRGRWPRAVGRWEARRTVPLPWLGSFSRFRSLSWCPRSQPLPLSLCFTHPGHHGVMEGPGVISWGLELKEGWSQAGSGRDAEVTADQTLCEPVRAGARGCQEECLLLQVWEVEGGCFIQKLGKEFEEWQEMIWEWGLTKFREFREVLKCSLNSVGWDGLARFKAQSMEGLTQHRPNTERWEGRCGSFGVCSPGWQMYVLSELRGP